MRNSAIVPVMGVLTVISGAVGLQLGESAIAQIDPIHFSSPRPPLRDVSTQARPEAPPSYASAYGWAEGYGAQAADCGDCSAPAARAAYAPLSEPSVGAGQEPWRAPITLERAEYEAQADTREWREISRYVHYPVTEEQARIAERSPAEPAVEAGSADIEAIQPAGL